MNIKELTTLDEVNDYFDCLDSRIIAVDIESEMNLHCYGEHLCLIQIYDRKNEIIIDPFAFSDKDELTIVLRKVFESRNLLKITYDSGSDASSIERLYKVKFKSVLDLKPAVELLEYEKQNLAYLLNRELAVPLISKKKFQTYNWMRRPIDPEALKYAISDVIYLFDLKERLMEKIIAKGLVDEYILLNLMTQNKEYVEPEPEEIFKRRVGYTKLPEKAKKRYKLFYCLREEYAEKVNKPPNTLLRNMDLLPLANKKVEAQRFLERCVNYRINKNIRKTFIEQLIKIY